MKYKEYLKVIHLLAGITVMIFLMGLYLSWAITGDTATKVEFIKVIPVTIIGLIAAGIAYRQYKAAKAKLNLDLFEKRYEIFHLTWGELSNAIHDVDEISAGFTNAIPKSQFLFGNEIHSYLKDIVHRRSMATMFKNMYRINNGLRPEDLEKYHETNLWLGHEAIIGARERFGKYMNFEEWK